MSDSEDIEESVCVTPPKLKKPKRLCQFNPEWKNKYKWLRDEGLGKAKCLLCCIEFSISNKGLSAVKTHENSHQHILKEKSANASKVMSNFFVRKNSSEELKVIYFLFTYFCCNCLLFIIIFLR